MVTRVSVALMPGILRIFETTTSSAVLMWGASIFTIRSVRAGDPVHLHDVGDEPDPAGDLLKGPHVRLDEKIEGLHPTCEGPPAGHLLSLASRAGRPTGPPGLPKG